MQQLFTTSQLHSQLATAAEKPGSRSLEWGVLAPSYGKLSETNFYDAKIFTMPKTEKPKPPTSALAQCTTCEPLLQKRLVAACTLRTGNQKPYIFLYIETWYLKLLMLKSVKKRKNHLQPPTSTASEPLYSSRRRKRGELAQLRVSTFNFYQVDSWITNPILTGGHWCTGITEIFSCQLDSRRLSTVVRRCAIASCL